jgi:hypothetical protein
MITLLTLIACGQPAHLQYDFSRAYVESFSSQATLDRQSAAADAYGIGGAEALVTRENARKAATDLEKALPTVTASAEAGK